MKRLFLLATTMLILQACETATEPGDYYVYNNPDAWLVDSKGCKVNKYYVPNAVEVEWTGPCYDGFAIGKGALSWVEADGTTGYYASCLQPDHYRSECLMGGGGGGHGG